MVCCTMGAREMGQAKLREQHRLKHQALLAAKRVKQDVAMPGERARIEHSLTNLEAEKVVLLLRSGLPWTACVRLPWFSRLMNFHCRLYGTAGAAVKTTT